MPSSQDVNNDNNIEFLNDNPGAVRYGNFINYYKFHPAQQRINLFPKHIWNNESNDEYICLDVGCNAGDLTIELYTFLTHHLNEEQSKKCKILGVDVDPTLILRAKETSKNSPQFRFECCDIMNDSREILTSYLHSNNKTYFNVIFCLSVTMWIHLNHGDEGLKQFLEKICDKCEMLVVEPQPWKCYKSAVKRLKQANSTFPMFETIKNRHNIETFIENIIENYNFHRIHETPASEWGRRILFYKRN